MQYRNPSSRRRHWSTFGVSKRRDKALLSPITAGRRWKSGRSGASIAILWTCCATRLSATTTRLTRWQGKNGRRLNDRFGHPCTRVVGYRRYVAEQEGKERDRTRIGGGRDRCFLHLGVGDCHAGCAGEARVDDGC